MNVYWGIEFIIFSFVPSLKGAENLERDFVLALKGVGDLGFGLYLGFAWDDSSGWGKTDLMYFIQSLSLFCENSIFPF